MSGAKSVFPTTPPAPTSRKMWWLGVIAVLVVVAVVAAVVVIVNRTTSHPDATPASPSTTAPAAAPTLPEASGGSGFTGTTVDKLNKPVQLPANPAGSLLPQTGKTPTDPNGVPAGLMWQKLYDLPIVPFSTSDGPTQITDGVARGWTHTPQGAALAATSILNLWLLGPDAVSGVVQRTLVSGDPAVLAQRANTNRPLRQAGLSDPEVAPSAASAVQIESYTGDFAQISYAAGPLVDDDHPDGFYRVTVLSVSWVEGTWKLIVTPTSPDRGEQRTSIAGLTPWTS